MNAQTPKPENEKVETAEAAEGGPEEVAAQDPPAASGDEEPPPGEEGDPVEGGAQGSEEPEAAEEPERADEPEGADESEGADAPAAPLTGEIEEVDATRSVEDLELELKAAQTRALEYKDRLLRSAADLENIKRRSSRELDDAKRYGIERLLKDLLPILDNFGRALSHAGDADTKAFVEGLDMVFGQFRGALERHGVTGFDSLGEKFDPSLHEAIHRKETDEAEPGTVVEEFQRGYKINGRLARPAMVIVAMAPPKPAVVESDEAPPDDVEATTVDVQASEPEDAAATEGAAPSTQDVTGHEEVVGAVVANPSGDVLDAAGAAYGAMVTEVREPSPAARAGLETGDIVTEVSGRPIMDARSFKRLVQQSLPRKQPFTIAYMRGGETHETKMGGR